MKKFILFVILLSCSVSANAAVRALGGNFETENNIKDTPSVNLSIRDASQECPANGFKLTRCEANEIAAYPCPFSSSYFRICCPQEYKYSQKHCLENDMEPSANSCGGFFACIPKKTAHPTQ